MVPPLDGPYRPQRARQQRHALRRDERGRQPPQRITLERGHKLPMDRVGKRARQAAEQAWQAGDGAERATISDVVTIHDFATNATGNVPSNPSDQSRSRR